MKSKLFLQCRECNNQIPDFKTWFSNWQKCDKCGGHKVIVHYHSGYEPLKKLVRKGLEPKNIWHYFDYLPLLDKKNIVTFNEGIVPIERWDFIERYAREVLNLDCRIYVQRNDLNPGTGTFKDMAGAVVASALRENRYDNYVVASTGNIATAYSKYLSAARIALYAFIPNNSSVLQEAHIGGYGQTVFRVDGDYEAAKIMAAEFAANHGILLAAGNFDPLRVEAKKTMVYEWLRVLEDFPTVYIQALSGGTGPLGIEKAFMELEPLNLVSQLPRQILVQSGKCAPMAIAWEKARDNNFPEGWQNDYPIIKKPQTNIPTLATGNPKTYPFLSQFVRKTGGDIIAGDESKVIHVARLIAMERAVLVGPAAALPVLGLFQALHSGRIFNGDIVVLNLGEGVLREPDFTQKYITKKPMITKLSECQPVDRNRKISRQWQKIAQLFT